MNTKNLLFLEFKEWLIGIFEDDPLPREITTIYFLYGKINNLVYMRVLGTEKDKNMLSDFTYTPLEAEFFYSNIFFKLFQKEKNKEKIKDFILNSLKLLKNDENLIELFNKQIKILEYNYYI